MEEEEEGVEEDVLSTGERWSSCASACCVSTSTVSPPSLPLRPGQTGPAKFRDRDVATPALLHHKDLRIGSEGLDLYYKKPAKGKKCP